MTPSDSIILGHGCGKYRFNGKSFGNVPNTELPRYLDIGQCNDSFSAVVIASELAKVLDCTIHDLPVHLVISWFEQKAVAVLLSLLHLNIQNIYLGPSLPGFVSPNVLDVLVDKFNIKPANNENPAADLKMM
eukprot:UN32144